MAATWHAVTADAFVSGCFRESLESYRTSLPLLFSTIRTSV
jgi:hypothetical protein